MAEPDTENECRPSKSWKYLSIEEKLERIASYKGKEKKSVLRKVPPVVMFPSKRRKVGPSGHVDGRDAKSWIAKHVACKVASSIVGLSSFVGDEFLFTCSGTVIGWNGMVATVLTSASLLKGHEDDVPSNVMVKVHLPTHETVPGCIGHIDLHHNVATIDILSPFELSCLQLDTEPIVPWKPVVAFGRHCETYDLLATLGNILVKDHGFDSDDILSSSCSITQYDIGGPLIDISSGVVIGMNFTDLTSSVFLPSNILLRCLEHFKNYGKCLRPWLGMRTRLLDSLDMVQLERILQNFPDVTGVFVEKVMRGSPADSAGVYPGDIITHCNRIAVCSPQKFTEILFDEVERACQPSSYANEKWEIHLEIVIKRKGSSCTETRSIVCDSLFPPEINRWPLYMSGVKREDFFMSKKAKNG